VNFFGAARLAGKDRAEVDLFVPQTDAATVADDKDVYLIERDKVAKRLGIETRALFFRCATGTPAKKPGSP